MWTATTRNLDKVQFENIRKQIDQKYNDLHDELSACYYNKKPFREYGLLDKATFDKLHGLVFLQRDVEFHEVNTKLSGKEQAPEEKYNPIDEAGVTKTERSRQQIEQLSKDGISLAISPTREG